MRSLSNQRGAASVLVILLIVVLATFGAVAIMAAWTQNGLGIRTAQRTAAFYALDGEAERIIAKVDQGLYEAQQKAANYMDTQFRENAVPEDLEGATLPRSFYREIKRTPPNLSMRSLMVEDIYTRVYYYYAAEALAPICEKVGARLTVSSTYRTVIDYLDILRPSPTPQDLTVSFSLLDESGMMLEVTLGANCDHYIMTCGEGNDWKKDMTMTPRGSRDRVQILMWKQRQQTKEDGQAPTYDGTVKKK